MSIPPNSTKITFGGALPGGEIWQSGFWVTGYSPSSSGDANSYAELWYAQLSASDSSGGARIHLGLVAATTVSFTQVRVYGYPAGGTQATYVGIYTGTAVTGTQQPKSGNQTAHVVSMRTGLAGRSQRGRMYIPANGAPVQADGQLNAAACTTIAEGWATCFSDWNAVSGNGIVSVVSSTKTQGYHVVNVQVDSRLDVQRRRADKQSITASETAGITVPG